MIRHALLSWACGVAGLSLLLSNAPWFRRSHLADRLRRHTPGASEQRSRIVSARSFRDALGPAAESIGSAVARAVGIHENLETRLTRLHRDESASQFRTRQLRVAFIVMLVVGLALAAVGLPAGLAGFMLLAAPALTLLVIEQRLSWHSDRWKRTLTLQLPLAEEQLAMLLDSGWSVGGALQHLANTSSGPIALDTERVLRSVRQGNSYPVALRSWASIANLVPVDRLATLLSLAEHGADLGRLVADEAQRGREERHRELLSAMERKAQQVWIPVTVAALAPGCMLLAVPFVRALSFFSS